jgi:hypothetical protein
MKDEVEDGVLIEVEVRLWFDANFLQGVLELAMLPPPMVSVVDRGSDGHTRCVTLDLPIAVRNQFVNGTRVVRP